MFLKQLQHITTEQNKNILHKNNLLNKEVVFFILFSMKTLAQFIQHKRDDLGLSTKGLAMLTNLPLEQIEDIESGKELFLSVTLRQNLAKVLKCSPDEIKKLEKDFNNHIVSDQVIESLKELILNEAGGLKCPVCGAPLVTRIQKLYDLEDNLMLHPKAHCTKCSFQIHS